MKKELGRQGESKAAEYLTQQGYKVIARNYHTRFGELDIICTKGNDMIFVEVKTRTSLKFGYPEEAITYKKTEHLKKAALIYMSNMNRPFGEMHFDVITILIMDGQEKINHIKDAF
ncbi:MAG TPA: YraN family protein [Syntrophomonadaceae bacterium]|nr:YraN family protein [Syntrophomonadaceae bacterium]HNX28566.1 YraN family protein [Syntrophomonadaceae bacterium]HPR92640.1 YraN family protein [Syntrophomonadaceae bacterium]